MDFSHFNDSGRARMVDVSGKADTVRTATAAGQVAVSGETFELIKSGGLKKGDVLATAQIAGIMAAKRTGDIIPMCHPLMLSAVDIGFSLDEHKHIINITATVRCLGNTGVEMEALTAVSAAALTIYDMCKAVQKDIVINYIRLTEKKGGKSGDYRRKEDD